MENRDAWYGLFIIYGVEVEQTRKRGFCLLKEDNSIDLYECFEPAIGTISAIQDSKEEKSFNY